MMKWKKSILLVFVIAIWVAIGYRFMELLDDSGESYSHFHPERTKTKDYMEDESDIPLNLNFRDPFKPFKNSSNRHSASLGKRTFPSEKKNSITQPSNTIKKNEQRSETWPEIEFSGVLINNNTNKKQAIYHLHSEIGICSENDSIVKNFFIKLISIDSIVLENNNLSPSKKVYPVK